VPLVPLIIIWVAQGIAILKEKFSIFFKKFTYAAFYPVFFYRPVFDLWHGDKIRDKQDETGRQWMEPGE
jgi:hypothetical protein